MTRTEKALAWGGGLIAALLVGLGIYEETKKPAAPAGTSMVTLTQGHRYRISFQCSSSNAAPQISALSGVNVVATDPMGNGGSIIVDYAGTTGSYPINNSGCSITVTDMGPSPAPVSGTNHGIPIQSGQGGAPLHAMPLPQSLTVTTNGSYTAQAIVNGKLSVKSVFPIAGIDASPAVVGQPQFLIGGYNANIVLSGNPGTIVIRGPSAGPAFQAPSATIQVG